MRRTVCLATYNGEKYIDEQLSSILTEIDAEDEVIIVDDKSSDNTIELIKRINDKRIKIFENDVNKGVNVTFERAISLSNGDIIFLADQDDIWIKGRIQTMTTALIHACLVSSNFDCFDDAGNSYKEFESKIDAKNSKKYFRNIIDIFLGKKNYYGCAMAFRKEIIPVILPFPPFIESHDLWIAKAANLIKSNIHIDDFTLHRRIHGNNISIVNRKIGYKLWSRIIFFVSIFIIIKRIIFNKEKVNM